MIQYRKLRINISEIRQNGVLCADPIVAWITQEGIFYPCIGEDYIEIEVPITADPKVKLVVQCDDCSVCPPIIIDRDLCTTSEDCADCEECIGGFCVPLCPNTLCINDTCVDCIGNDDCPDNKICSAGKCICPPDKPFTNKKGECVACLTDENCDACAYCSGGDCVPKECGDGVCNPLTGNCVQCNNNGDCGENECCNNNKCSCCDGFHWDYTLEKCVADPECFTETDCAVCESCVGGNCVEIPLRDGYIATNQDGVCVILKTCACGGTDCPQGYACVSYDGDTCVCVKCEGTCSDNGDCGDGCFCGDTNICLPSPCNGDCENAGDCGENCGCLNGRCVPCDSVNCSTNPEDCAAILGCECKGTHCGKQDDSCDNPCTYAGDCGEGCGCDNEDCVPCGYYNCDNGDCASIPGCMCNPNGLCVEDPGDKECDSELTLIKSDGECDLSAILSGNVNCVCSPISVGITPNTVLEANHVLNTFTIELRKGDASKYLFESLPLLNDTTNWNIADNEMPINATITICNTIKYRNILTNEESSSIENCSIVMNLVTNETTDFIFAPKIGSTHPSNANLVVTEVSFRYKNSTFVFPNNCTYAQGSISGYKYNQNPTNGYKPSTTIILKSNSNRDPLFMWAKTDNGIFSENFRKHYVAKVGNTYIDTLYGMGAIPKNGVLSPSLGELWGNRDYKIAVDCGCAEAATLTDVQFCNPEDIVVSWIEDACNKQVIIQDFEPCDVNKNKQLYESYGYTIPENAQAKYYIYKNGTEPLAVLKHSYSHNKMKIMGGSVLPYIFSSADPIDNITIKLGYDGAGEQCIWSYNAPTIAKPNITTTNLNCSGDFYILRLSKAVSGGLTMVNLILPNGSQIVANETLYYDISVPINTEISLGILYDSGCTFYYEIPANTCIGNYSVDLQFNSEANCGDDLVLRAVVTGGVAPFMYHYVVPKATDGYYEIDTTDDEITIAAGTFGSGSATVEVRDNVAQSAFDSCILNPIAYTFTATPTITTCTSSSYDIVITGTPNAVVTSTIPGNTEITIPISGTITISLTAGGSAGITSYAYTQIVLNEGESNECTRGLSDTTIVTTIATPTATMTATDPSVCNNVATLVGFTGTPGATVSVLIRNLTTATNVGTYNVVLNGGGVGSLAVPTTQAQYRITKQSVTLGSCINTATTYFDVSVSQAPTISILSNTYTCNPSLTYYSVQFISDYAPWGVSAGSVEVIDALNHIYRVYNIPTETASIITVKNGACTVTATTLAYACDCSRITVTPPVGAPNSYDYCDDEVIPTLTVTCSNIVNWYSSSIGGTLLSANSLTYTPTSGLVAYGGNWFYAEAEDANGCKSARTLIYLFKNATPGGKIIPPAVFCGDTTQTFQSDIYNNPTSYVWSATNAVIVGSTTGKSATITLPSTGESFTITLDVTNNAGCTTTFTYEGESVDCCIEDKCITQYFSMDASGGDLELVGFTDNNGNLCAGFHGEVFTDDSQAGNDAVLTAIETNLPLCCPNLDWGNFDASIIYKDDNDMIVLVLTGSPITYTSLATTGNNGAETWAAVTTACDAGTCIWNITAEQTEEGCYSAPDGGDFNIDVDYESGVCGGSHILTFQCYVNGEAVRTYQTTGTCATGTFSINASNILMGVDMTTILTAANNELSIVASCNSVAKYITTLLIFPANDCA